jgi:hypothetical protein
MEVPKSDIVTPDAVHNADAVKRTSTGVTALRANEIEEITPIATHMDSQTRPKSLDEPFKIRYQPSSTCPEYD